MTNPTLSRAPTADGTTTHTARRIAVVTGAGQGIGRAIALRLARDGMDIAICELNETAGGGVAAEVAELGRRAEVFAADVTQGEAVRRAFAGVVATFGTLDVVVNNVGGGGSPPTLLVDLREEHWNGSLDSNLKSTFLCAQTAARILIDQHKGGRIINIASINGKVGSPLLGAYSVAKAGVIRLTEVLARELASQGITVNAVCPGVADTTITQKILARHPEVFGRAFSLVPTPGETMREALEQHIPLGRLADPEDVAGVVSFLASSDADYMTGQALNVAGGMIAH